MSSTSTTARVPSTIGRLAALLKQAQRAGSSLAEIRALLRLRDDSSTCCGDVRARVIDKRREFQSRIDAMHETAQTHDRMIAGCRGGAQPTDACPILAALGADAAPPRADPQRPARAA